MPCFGDSCSCYGDPEAPNANAGCVDCTPEPTCEKLRDRVAECGIPFEGSLSSCEARVRAEHTCIEGVESTSCDVLKVACPNHDAACFSELLTTGATACKEGLVRAADGGTTAASCASGHCLDGVCVECEPFYGWECAQGFTCSMRNRCVRSCEDDADCGSDTRCFAGECDPALATPCADELDCGTLSCFAQPGSSKKICTTLCGSTCEPGSFCGCPAGFTCVDMHCLPL